MTNKYNAKLIKTLNNSKELIPNKQLYISSNPEALTFLGLPKIHKNESPLIL